MLSIASSELMAIPMENVAVDLQQFEAVFALYRPKLFRFLLASLRDRDAAESLSQDCLWKAYQTRDRFRGECRLETWLMRIAVNLMRDYLRNTRLQFWRRAKRHGPAVEDIENRIPGRQHSPEATALLRERVTAVWSAADELPERQRTVFLLRFVEDMEILEIAAATGMKEGTVKTHLFRAVHSVRLCLGPGQ